LARVRAAFGKPSVEIELITVELAGSGCRIAIFRKVFLTQPAADGLARQTELLSDGALTPAGLT
jgi:hypothetical protein